MSKFKIGDTIHYMESNKPQSSVIIGIAKYEGKIKGIRNEHTVKENEQKIIYHFDNYSETEEKDAFSTKEELQTSIFND